jgi:hypothetical protein
LLPSYAKNEISFLFIILYVRNFLPRIPYTVVLHEDGEVDQEVQHSKSLKKIKSFVVTDGLFTIKVTFITLCLEIKQSVTKPTHPTTVNSILIISASSVSEDLCIRATCDWINDVEPHDIPDHVPQVSSSTEPINYTSQTKVRPDVYFFCYWKVYKTGSLCKWSPISYPLVDQDWTAQLLIPSQW